MVRTWGRVHNYIGAKGTGMNGISDQRCVERTLRESEPFARSVLDSLSANIAVLDESGTVVFFNRAWRECTTVKVELPKADLDAQDTDSRR